MEDVAGAMAISLVHRGPDDGGIWSDNVAGVALSHRRLAIVDLSEAGHQPMYSACGRYIIVFNGEIYNHQHIRERLEATGQLAWKGHSDTETLLSAVATWGIERALQAAVGMFAFALWDRQTRTLSLARDRLGERPLYFGMQQDSFIFGSELKAFRAHPSFLGEVDRGALMGYLQGAAVPTPRSIYRGIHKLPPGTWLSLTRDDVGRRIIPVAKQYWSLSEVVTRAQAELFVGNLDDAVENLDYLLRQAVKGQMLSDVPLGAFLSGGVDSSTIVALMQAQSNIPIKTFTIGFEDKDFNEADHARAVSAHLGTEHTELLLKPEQALEVIPRLPQIYDEPFADVSQIPTFLVSELAKTRVTVSLSGDGGDEVFGGYNRYTRATDLWRKFRWLPRSGRLAVARVLTSFPPSSWDKILDGLRCITPSGWRYSTAGDKLHKVADMLEARSADDIYFRLVSRWHETESPLTGTSAGIAFSPNIDVPESISETEHRMMYLDTMTYLPDDVLVKVDRAAMAASLEARAPFLDHRVVEFAWSLPLSFKINEGHGKVVLNRVLERYVPKSITSRPKTGFAVPIDAWLRGPLANWANELIDPVAMQRQGYLDVALVRTKWEQHLSGERNFSRQLWPILMFQAWLCLQ